MPSVRGWLPWTSSLEKLWASLAKKSFTELLQLDNQISRIRKGDLNMQPQLSICRKRENLYLKLTGHLNEASSEEILHAVKRLVTTSLQFSSPEAQVVFTFQTHAKNGSPKDKEG